MVAEPMVYQYFTGYNPLVFDKDTAAFSHFKSKNKQVTSINHLKTQLGGDFIRNAIRPVFLSNFRTHCIDIAIASTCKVL